MLVVGFFYHYFDSKHFAGEDLIRDLLYINRAIAFNFGCRNVIYFYCGIVFYGVWEFHWFFFI